MRIRVIRVFTAAFPRKAFGKRNQRQGIPDRIEPKKGRRDGHSVVIQPNIGRPQQLGEILDRRAIFTEDCLNYRRDFFAGRALSPIFSAR